MKIIHKHRSPNFDSRADQEIDTIILHYTGMESAGLALHRLCDAQAKVSAHYLVDEDGAVFNLVDENDRAWHAGVSYWRGNSNINQRSIGIEIVNPGHEFGYRPFPKLQMQAARELCSDILSRHKIPARNIIGHSDVAPARKQDPGELFDWKFLADHGIGLFPNAVNLGPSAAHAAPPNGASPRVARPEIIYSCHPSPALEQYGYDTASLPQAITAFQRHFRQNNISGEWDDECAKLLAALLKMI